MKPRHAAALALVGWYLMTPPLTGSSGIATQAPLTQWTVIGSSYPSEEKCQQAKQDMLPSPTQPNHLDAQHLLSVQESKCVSMEPPPPKEIRPAQ
jgi:hypothetical protein